MARTRRRTQAALLALLTTAALLAAPGMAPGAAQEPADIPVNRLAGPDRVGTAVAVSRAAFPAAGTALLARADDFADALVAAPLAAAVEGPILLTATDRLPPATAEELDRLGVAEVLILGGEAAVGSAVVRALEREGREARRLAGPSRYHTAEAVAAELRAVTAAIEEPDDDGEADADEADGDPADADGADADGADGDPADGADPPGGTVLVATGESFPDALAAGPLAAVGGSPILLVTRDGVPDPTRRALDAIAPERIVILGGAAAVGEGVAHELGRRAPLDRIAGATRFGTAAAAYDAAVATGLDPHDVWLADGRDFPDALVAGPVVGASGGTLLLVDGSHLAARPSPYQRLRAGGADLRRVTLLGGSAAVNADAPHQLQGVALGPELPRGGRLLFPHHRIVALYGHARSDRMGALGQQPPEAAAERTKRVAAEWDDGGRTVLPAFELIVTVAHREPGPDGLYRSVGDLDEIRTYLEVARRHGLYLFLDVQPGRSDFLTEVRHYEELLREPDVGLALDPEWRMHGSTRPGQEVGWVHADEVNQVVDYVAGIVREHRLPQKLLVVHQFTHDMIRERHRIRTPDELSVNFHADGFGSRAAKRSKYESFLAPPPYSMGFKLFYDEDTDLFAPADVLAFPRPPDLITYQ
jgi:putative cell wall-binding protein